jgi:signal transduction histidine kinase/CheY-like chemotaxis protein
MKRLGWPTETSVTAKIWGAIGIFIVGFLLSALLVQLQGMEREKSLRSARSNSFPAAQAAQHAEETFLSCVRALNNAVVMLELADLARAQDEGGQTLEALRALEKLGRPSGLGELKKKLERFLSTANSVYPQAIQSRTGFSSELQSKMLALAEETKALSAQLAALRESSTQELQGQLEELHTASRRQRWLMLIVLAGTCLVAALAMNFTIHRAVTDPILRMNADLAEAKLKADAANVAKGNFLANMSHEIRTPMNGVLGMAEAVLQTPLSNEQRGYIRTLRDSADALMVVINDILDFSKIEAGRLDLDPIPFPLRDLVESCVQALAVPAQRKRLQMFSHVDAAIPDTLVADSMRIRQILLNLIGNGIKFTAAGEISVEVKWASLADGRRRVHFSVRDTGIGIPKKRQAEVFQPFTQADNSITRKFGGTGLGLTISTRLVELMGGTIWLESEVGQGSCFHFTIEVEELPAAGPPDGAKRIPARGAALLVEPSAMGQRMLSGMLADWGVPSVAVASLAEAKEAILSRQGGENGEAAISLLIVDSQLPDGDAFELVEFLRGQAGLEKLPLLRMSIGESEIDKERRFALDLPAPLMKPLRRMDLYSEVLKLFTGSTVAANPIPHAEAKPPAASRESGLNILVVEDNLVNQKVIRGLLRKTNHAIEIASNGIEAVQAYRAKPFDVILMDIQMPEMNGLEATAIIREAEQGLGVRTPIVALTAKTLPGDRDACLQAGMDAYLSKPVNSADLLALLARVGSARDSSQKLDADRNDSLVR